MQKKLTYRIKRSNREQFRHIVIIVLSFLLVIVIACNVSTFARILNMYNYDRYLDNLYALKQEKGLSALAEINSDLLGYIECEDLNMHLPVVETEDKNKEDFYLDHDFRKMSNELGTPYQKSTTSVGETTVSTFVGHSAFTETLFNEKKNQTIFGKLNQYLYKSTAFNYVITFETFTELFTFKVIGVLKFNAKSGNNADEMSVYNTINITSRSQFNSFYQKIQDHTVVSGLDTAEYGDKFLTLFTCSTNDLNYRVMVIAKLTSQTPKS
ncbi:MAG: class B sortase [Clostridia bacterium]|nr:class B sortase [Clostridia bacterium]